MTTPPPPVDPVAAEGDEERPPCPICRALGAVTEWGESASQPLPAAPPAQAHALEREEGTFYRCPTCRNRYDWRADSSSFLNADYESQCIRRLGPREYPAGERDQADARLRAELADPAEDVRRVAATVLARDRWGRPDEYRRDLLESTDATVRLTALRCLFELDRDGSDAALAELEPTLRGLAVDTDEISGQALHLLALHLLRTGRRHEAVALLGQAPPAARGRLLDLLAWPLYGPVDTAELLPHLRVALRARPYDGWCGGALEALLSSSAGGSVLAALEEWWAQGDAIPLFPPVVRVLVARLADADPVVRATAFGHLVRAPQETVRISETLAALSSALARDLPASHVVRHPADLLEGLTKGSGRYEPLALWAAVLAHERPGEAVGLLAQVLERGGAITLAREVLEGLASQAPDAALRGSAAGLLRRMTDPAWLEAARRLERVADGSLVVGGGPTTEAQWVLCGRDGRFFIEGTSERGAAPTREVSRAEALALLSQRRYQWEEPR